MTRTLPIPAQRAGQSPADRWQLVTRAQAGDVDAFAAIYEQHADAVYRFLLRRSNGNRELAQDITQDVFVNALRAIGTVTWQGRDIGAWLTTIARNRLADHFKSGRHRTEVLTADEYGADRPDRTPEGDPASLVAEHLNNLTLISAVRQLTPEQCQCIVLRFLAGLSIAETAAAMGKNDGAIKALQLRAVRALRVLLDEQGVTL